MTFLEALKTGRPIRRVASTIMRSPWYFLGEDRGGGFRSCWRRIDTGEAVGLDRGDYEAVDWEAMP